MDRHAADGGYLRERWRGYICKSFRNLKKVKKVKFEIFFKKILEGQRLFYTKICATLPTN